MLWFSLALAASLQASAEPPSPDTMVRLMVGLQGGADELAGWSLRAQVFHQITRDESGRFYDLGGEMAWEAGGPRLSLGTRHTMYFMTRPRFEQSVLLGLAWPSALDPVARHARLSLSGTFGVRFPLGDGDGPRGGPGAHLLWSLSAPTRSLRQPGTTVGVGASWTWSAR